MKQSDRPILVAVLDDEPLARERIRSMLVAETEVEILGEFGSGVEALPVLRKQRPDLVFLDIQMPEMNGFEFLEQLGEPLPLIIFVTAFDQHALRAFEHHALDYLLKPFKVSRFQETLRRALDTIRHQKGGDVSDRIIEMLEGRKQEAQWMNRISVKIEDRLIFLKVESVDWIEAAGNYLLIHVGKESHMIRETLTAMESKLDPSKFLRISRSILVNLARIKELQPLFNGEYAVVLDNGKHLTMTRGLREVEDRLKFS